MEVGYHLTTPSKWQLILVIRNMEPRENYMTAYFFVMNEKSDILGWQLTKRTAINNMGQQLLYIEKQTQSHIWLQ